MRAHVQRIRGALIRRINYKVTKGGVLYLVAVIFVGVAAVISGNNLLYLIVATMFSSLLVSGFISRLCLAGLQLDFMVPEHVSAGRTVSARLYVRNSKVGMPSFSIQVAGIEDRDRPVQIAPVYFPVIPGRATLEELVEVRFGRRGAHQQNSFVFLTRFPFGFLEKTARVVLRREVIVYPSLESKPGFEDLLDGIRGEMETHYRGLGRDFYRIRPYEAFESARHVDWKATAKTGELQVREFAREQERSVEVFLDRDVPPGMEEWFEQAVDCCAFLCWRLSQQSASIRFRTQEWDFRVPEEGGIYTILKYLALVSPVRGKAPEPPFDELSYQVVFTVSAQSFENLGWTARVVGPDALGPTAGKDVHHGGGEDHRRNPG